VGNGCSINLDGLTVHVTVLGLSEKLSSHSVECLFCNMSEKLRSDGVECLFSNIRHGNRKNRFLQIVFV
jgi:hypothetical protein